MRNRPRPNHMFALLVTGLLLLLGGGCESMQEVLSSLDRPTARITGARLTDWTLEGASLDFDVDVSNPYSLPLPLANLNYTLRSGGKQIIDGRAPLNGVIAAGDTQTITLPTSIRFDDLINALRTVRPGSVVPYEADLGLAVDAPGVGPLGIPLKKTGDLPIPAAPKVAVDSVNWRELTLQNATAVVNLNIENTNQFPLDLSTLDYALSLGGRRVANTTISESIGFEPGAARTLEIPLSISPMDLGMGVFNMIRGNGASYDIGGDMNVNTPFGPINLPFQRTGQTAFN